MKHTIRGLGWLFCAVFLSVVSTHASTNEYRGFWVDTFHNGLFTEAQVTTLVNDTRNANCNMIVAEIRKRGDAYYNGSIYEPKGSNISPPSFDPLGDLLAKAHDTSGGKQRIEIHAWLVTYKVAGITYSSHPTWVTKDDVGNTSSEAFDPSHPDVQRHIFNVSMDIVSRYDIDGINYDYIRYDGHQWGYNPVAIARFNAKYGRTGQPAKADPDWKQFRRDQVTALVRKIYLNTMAIKPHVKVSADTITWGNQGVSNEAEWYATSGAYTDVLQDWRGWLEEGMIDLSIPMNYYRHHNNTSPNHAAAYTNWMNFIKDHKYDRHVAIGPGIYLNYTSNAIAQMRATRDLSPNGNSGQGVVGYSYAVPTLDGLSFANFRALLTNSPNAHDPQGTAIFAGKATIPEMPWKVAPTKGHLKGFIYGTNVSNTLDGASFSITGPVNRTNISDATGFYGSVDLPVGTYTITASFPGYEPASTNVTITAGVVSTRDFTLFPPSIPSIQLQPASQTINETQPATFTVSTLGATPFFYQWLFDGNAIGGANASSYTINSVVTSDEGNYSVIVSNAFGSITSSNAYLTVIPAPVPPSIQIDPQNQSVNAGDFAFFSVTASGDAPLSYYWQFNNAFISGANFSTVSVPNAEKFHEGNYRVIVSNAVGVVTSAVATLSVNLPPPPEFGTNGGAMVNGQFQLTFNGHDGSTYLVECSTNLSNWTPLTTVDGQGQWATFTDPEATNHAQRFYRARRAVTYHLTDFENIVTGAGVVLRHPSFSGPTSSYVEGLNFTRVTEVFPAGNTSTKVLHSAWSFKVGISNSPWLRLSTAGAIYLPSPTVSLDQAIRFDVYCDKDVYLTVGLRESGTTAEIGKDGGNAGPIEWVGGRIDNTSYPSKGWFIPSNQWVTVHCFIPYELVRGYTGDGIISSPTGKGTFEHIGLTPGSSGYGPYNLYIDNLKFINLSP